MKIQGLHHITLVCRAAQRTVDFYTGVLGLRLVKKTVNFDDPGSYHLYFGDDIGRPGTAITYFEWPLASPGRPGIGGTHHFALTVADYDGLLQWKRRLTDLSLPVDGPYDRHYFTSIYLNDPDGTIIEIATKGPGWTVDEEPETIGSDYREPPVAMIVRNRDEETIAATTWPAPVPGISATMTLNQGMHHITAIGTDIQRTNDFLNGVLGLRRVKMTSNFDDPSSAHWYWGGEDGQPGTLITYFERDPNDSRYRRVQMGSGQTHHFAFSVPDQTTAISENPTEPSGVSGHVFQSQASTLGKSDDHNPFLGKTVRYGVIYQPTDKGKTRCDAWLIVRNRGQKTLRIPCVTGGLGSHISHI